MGVRRLLSLVRGLGYEFRMPENPGDRLSSPGEIKRFFRGSLRYSGGE